MSTTYREGRVPVEHEGETVPLSEVVALVVRKRAAAPEAAKGTKTKAPAVVAKVKAPTKRKAAPAKKGRRR